jgi:hypothetical protein
MKFGPIFPIFGEDFSFDEELAAIFRDFPRATLRDHVPLFTRGGLAGELFQPELAGLGDSGRYA